MNLLESKITAMITLGLGSLLMGLLPVLLTRFSQRRSPLLLSSLLCFGAGVLFATALIHMLPEIRGDLGSDYQKYAELILCCGFFILYIIDEIVHIFYKKKHNHANRPEIEDPQPSISRRHSFSESRYGSMETNPLLQPQPPYNPAFRGHSEESGLNTRHRREHHLISHIEHEELCRPVKIATISLLTALTIHAILEGLAVGLENNSSQVLVMLGAVASHKLVVGFCLGTELSSSIYITACQYFISIILFSFGSSLGIGIGIGVADLPGKLPILLLPILQGLAGGTLLYVTVCEVLPRERAQWHQKPHKYAGILQLISTVLGFTGMTVLIHFTSS